MPSFEERRIGERIRTERRRRDMSQSRLAAICELDRSAMNRIENGERRVAALELSNIARALDVPMHQLLHEPLTSIASYREAYGLESTRSSINDAMEQIATQVELLVDQGAHLDGPPIHPTRPQSTPEVETLAMELRRTVGLAPDEPLASVARTASQIGLWIFGCDLGDDAPDAGTILLRQGGIAVVNSRRKIGRRRLAAAHEIGHYLAQDEYTVDWRTAHSAPHDPEMLFDAFARALLVPSSGLSHRWQTSVSSDGVRVAAIIHASRYQVDMATLARRLLDLELIDPSEARTIRETRTTQSDMIELDLHAPPEELSCESQPREYQRAVLGLVRSEKLSRDKALSLLPPSFGPEDLPAPRVRAVEDVWRFVS